MDPTAVRARALKAAAAAAVAAAAGATPAQAERLAGEAVGVFIEAAAAASAAVGGDGDDASPAWAGPPPTGTAPWTLEIIRSGVVVAPPSPLPVNPATGAATVGRSPDAAIIIEHASSSRCHARLQVRSSDGALFIRDQSSTHGTCVGADRLPPRAWARVRAGAVLRFGASTRLYVLGGGPDDDDTKPAVPAAPAPRRPDTAAVAAAEMQRALKRGRRAEDDDDEEEPGGGDDNNDWRALRSAGRLTERQATLATRIDKCRARASALRAEADAIRAKTTLEGVTAGQAATLARNDDKADALEGEADDAEEALCDSLAAGAAAAKRAKRGEGGGGGGRGRRAASSDNDDDYFDRTNRNRVGGRAPAAAAEEPALDAATLVAHRDALRAERAPAVAAAARARAEAGRHDGSTDPAAADGETDALDAFMVGVGRDAAADAVAAADAAVSALDAQLAEVEALLKVADPDGWVVGH